MDFIERLKQIQQARQLFDAGMAEKIGCTRQMYQMVRTRKARPGREFLSGVLSAFPQLEEAVWTVWRSKIDEKPSNGFLARLKSFFEG